MMEFKSIINKIKEAGNSGSKEFFDTYLKHEGDIVKEINSFEGIKSDVYLQDINSHDKHIKLAGIFSDLTSVFCGQTSKGDFHISFFKDGSPYNYDRDVTIPSSLTSQIKPEFEMTPGYMYNNNDDIKKLFIRVDTLLNSGRLLIRPIRALLVKQPKEFGKVENMVYYADGNTDPRHWIIRDKYYDENSIPIETSLDSAKLKPLFDITLPYFENTSLENFSKIILEETDLLSSFRVELKSFLKSSLNKEPNLDEIRNDIIRPRLDTINRKFEAIKNAHRKTILGDVIFFSLSLFAIKGISNTNIQEIITSLISGGGVIGKLFYNEVKYDKELNTLKDDPLFLLWKIERTKRKH